MRVLGRLRRFVGVRGDGAEEWPAGLSDASPLDAALFGVDDAPAAVCARNLPDTISLSVACAKAVQ